MFEGLTVLELFQKSPIMFVLLICSVISVTFALERWWYFRRSRLNVSTFMGQISRYLRRAELTHVIAHCKRARGPIPRIINTAIANISLPREEVDRLMDIAAEKEEVKLERNLPILGTLSNIAPLLGLFGTVMGIIRAFRDIAITGSGGSSVVAMGVAEALLTTAAGIVIAVISTVFYNYFMRKIRILQVDVDDARGTLWSTIQETGENSG